MQISFFNPKTNKECFTTIPDEVALDIENTLLIFDHDSGASTAYKIVSTVPTDIQSVRNHQHEFIEKEFDALEEKFNFKSEAEIPSDFLAVFSKVVDPIIQERYPEFYKEIEDRKEAVYASLSMSCVGNILAKIYSKKQEEEAKPKTTGCFLLDYSEYCADCFSKISLEDSESILAFSKVLTTLQNARSSEEERRSAGYELLMLRINDVLKDIMGIITDNSNRKGELWDIIDQIKNDEKKEEITDKLKVATDKAVDYFKVVIPKYLDSMVENISSVEDMKKSATCLAALCKLINDFGKALEQFDKAFENADGEQKVGLAQARLNTTNQFILHFEMVVAACDYLKLEKDEYTESIDKIWTSYISHRTSDLKNTDKEWDREFLKDCSNEWKELFSPLTIYKTEKSVVSDKETKSEEK